MPRLMPLTHLIIFPGLFCHHSAGQLLQEGKQGEIRQEIKNGKYLRWEVKLKSFLQI